MLGETTEEIRGRTVAVAQDPLFILAPPCTFSWVVCAILGEHPQMYALPELHLFTSDSMREWQSRSARASYDMAHGLVRAVAEIIFGAQTDATVSQAQGWLVRRDHLTTGMLLELLTRELAPLLAVEKSPSLVFETESLERMWEMFPCARFLHLASHPRLYGESVMLALSETSKGSSLPASHWLVRLAKGDVSGPRDGMGVASEPDPQRSWLLLHNNILEFLKTVPDAQKRLVRGEELNQSLEGILRWLDLRTDQSAIEMMKHPERSIYARSGPSSAPYGSDIFVRAGPLVRPEWADRRSLEGSVGWRHDGTGLSSEVKDLARGFGYQ